MDIETAVETAVASVEEEEGFSRHDLIKIAAYTAAAAVTYVGVKKMKRVALKKLATTLAEKAAEQPVVITDLPETTPETVNA